MKNMYAIVLCLVVITSTSSVSCCSLKKDEEIFMVVDDHTSTMQPRMGINKAEKGENPVQIGRFQLKEGKTLTLSRPLNRKANCISVDQPCGLLDWCCDDLNCDGYFDGRCNPCTKEGETCDHFHRCCSPLTCLAWTDVSDGVCIDL